MLHKILLLMGILTFTGAKSQISESYEPNFSKFKVTDFGFHGNIRTITSSFLKKNEQGEYQPSAWKTIKIHHNFDDKGNLISEYGIGHDLDTCEITFYTYNENNLISQVKNYEKGYWGEYTTSDLRNWQYQEASFEYDEMGNKVKETISKYAKTHVTLNEYNANKQIVKSVRLDTTSETNSSMDKTEYFYNSNAQLIKIVTKNENQVDLSGETILTYEKGELVSEIFTHLDGTLGSKILRKKGKVDLYNGNDTLTNYSKSIYNDKGELIKSFNHYDGDGEFKSNTQYSYAYDENKNLKEVTTLFKSEIAHSRETNTEEFQKIIYEISYY